jgi:hypothetical protein
MLIVGYNMIASDHTVENKAWLYNVLISSFVVVFTQPIIHVERERYSTTVVRIDLVLFGEERTLDYQ